MVKDIQSIEKIQRRATKYILSDYNSDYKSRLLSLNLLPLMYWLDLQDLVFFIKCLKDPNDTIGIYCYVNFVEKNRTRAGMANKLQHKFARLSSEIIDLNLSVYTNKVRLTSFLWEHFKHNFDSNNLCSFHFVCPCYKCV